MMAQEEQYTPVNKVTVGFKCNPALRMSLSQKAERLGTTLSAYVETCVAAYEANEESLQRLTLETERLTLEKQRLTGELRGLTEEVKSTREALAFYENTPILQSLLRQYKGQNVPFTNSEGKKVSQKIDSLKDVFTVFVDSFRKERE